MGWVFERGISICPWKRKEQSVKTVVCEQGWFLSLAWPTTECRAGATSLRDHRKLFWQLSRDRNSHGSGCNTPQQPLQNHPSGHQGEWMMPWSAEELLDGQHQRVDISASARTAHKGLLQERLEEALCWIIPHVLLMTQAVKGLNWTEPNHRFRYRLSSNCW